MPRVVCGWEHRCTSIETTKTVPFLNKRWRTSVSKDRNPSNPGSWLASDAWLQEPVNDGHWCSRLFEILPTTSFRLPQANRKRSRVCCCLDSTNRWFQLYQCCSQHIWSRNGLRRSIKAKLFMNMKRIYSVPTDGRLFVSFNWWIEVVLLWRRFRLPKRTITTL